MWHSYLHSCGSCFCGFSSSHMKMFQITCCSICLAQLFSLYLYSPITINHKSNQNNSYSTHGWGSSILSSPSTKWVDWRESYKVLSFKSSKKYLSLLEIGSPAKFQPVPFSSLHLFFSGSREFECIFSEVACTSCPHVPSHVFKGWKNKRHLKSSLLCKYILVSPGKGEQFW